MKTLINITAMALVASLTLATVSAPTANAQQPQAMMINPGPGPFPGPAFALPKFGFNSFNIAGYGERVTYVQWGGLASQLGLEPGDTILRLNNFVLGYHGSWNDALYQAMLNGGWVQLTIRDVRTGWLVHRQVYLGNGGGGPITPHYQVTNYGPVTAKSVVGPHPHHHGNSQNVAKSIKQIVELFKD